MHKYRIGNLGDGLDNLIDLLTSSIRTMRISSVVVGFSLNACASLFPVGEELSSVHWCGRWESKIRFVWGTFDWENPIFLFILL